MKEIYTSIWSYAKYETPIANFNYKMCFKMFTTFCYTI